MILEVKLTLGLRTIHKDKPEDKCFLLVIMYQDLNNLSLNYASFILPANIKNVL
jgi:hypothetical protein